MREVGNAENDSVTIGKPGFLARNETLIAEGMELGAALRYGLASN